MHLQFTGAGEIRPELLDNFMLRGGFLKPAEGAERIPMVDKVLAEDLAAVRATR